MLENKTQIIQRCAPKNYTNTNYGDRKCVYPREYIWQISCKSAEEGSVFCGIAHSLLHETNKHIMFVLCTSYYLFVNGDKTSSSDEDLIPYESWQNEDILTITLDMKEGTLSFKINSTDHGIAYSGIDISKDYQLVAMVSKAGDSCKILSFEIERAEK